MFDAWGYRPPGKKIVKPQGTQGPGVYGTQYYQQPGQPQVSTAPPPSSLPSWSNVPNVSTPIAQGQGKTVAPGKPLNTDPTLIQDLAGIGLEGQGAFQSENTDYNFNKASAAQSLAQSLAGSDLSLSQAQASTAQEKATAQHGLAQTLAQLAFQKPQDILGQARSNHAAGLINSAEQNMDIGNINKDYSMRESNARTDYSDHLAALNLALDQLAARVKQDKANAQANYNLEWDPVTGHSVVVHNQNMEQLVGKYGAPDASGKYQPPQWIVDDPTTGAGHYSGGGLLAQGAISNAIGRATQDAIDHPPAVIDPAAVNTNASGAQAATAQQIASRNANAANAPVLVNSIPNYRSPSGAIGTLHVYSDGRKVFVKK